MLSEAVQDYLKAIYKLQEQGGVVSTSALAQALEVTAASATGMVKKLASLRLVRHSPYQGVVLSKAGRKVALEVLRHHRLLELYLAEALGYPWDKVHDEADRLETSRIIMEELVNGRFTPEAVRTFQKVIGRLKDAGCDAVVLGCTEIPLIISDANSPLPTLDSTRLLARAALRRAMG